MEALPRAWCGGGSARGIAAKAVRAPARGGQRLTLTDVRDESGRADKPATSELADGLFAEREVAWQATVRGRLSEALAAMAAGGEDARLASLIVEALVRVELI
jgi:hypothetical protein